MALDNFIPVIWSARLLARLQKALVYGQAGVVNRDYEGEIADVGDTVRINSIGPVSIFPYVKNTDMPAPETLNDAAQMLTIDQAQAFNFQVDDIDRAQQKPKVMDEAMREAGYALADVADQYLAGLMWQAAPATSMLGAIGSPVDIGYGANEMSPYIALLRLGRFLDEKNIPRAGRWAIVPPWFEEYLVMDGRIVGSGADAADTRAVNGRVGRAAGFDILVSNNVPFLPGGTEYKIVAGTSLATSYAEQINKVEAYRPQLRFADAVKGLHLYGAKVVRPEALALLVADIGTPAT